jgi:hypothetical protein
MAAQDEYKDIMNSNGGIAWDNNPNYDDDTEDVFTSKEIVQRRDALAKLQGKKGNTSDDDGIIEEDVIINQRYRNIRQHRYTETEMAKIRESCMTTIVHDYGEHDKYHISDEERSGNDQLREINDRLQQLKGTYRRVDQYIAAMRVVFEAWEILARLNFLHTKEEFFSLIAEGTIVSPRIVMPKLRKIDQYNLDMIITLISNPDLDISHLAPIKKKSDEDWFNDDDEEYETEEEEMMRILSPQEVEYIYDRGGEDPLPLDTIKITDMPKKFIKGYDKRANSFSRQKKKKRKGNKTDRFIQDNLHNMLSKIQNGQHYKDHGNSYMVTHSLFEQEKPVKSFWDDVHFDASWSDDDAVAIFDMVIREELMKQNLLNKRHLTYADMDLARFFEVLEEHKLNTVYLRQQMGVTQEDADKREMKATTKENRKKEKELLNRVIALNNNDKFKKITKKAEADLNEARKGDIPELQ